MKKTVIFSICAAPLLLVLAYFSYSKAEDASMPSKNSFPCVSYAPKNIEQKTPYERAELEEDLRHISRISLCVRIYGSTNGLELVPTIAKELGMEVIIGAWLENDADPESLAKNIKEIRNLIDIANTHDNIRAVIVSNEALLMNRISKSYLIEQIRIVQNAVKQPVSIAEPYAIWASHDDLLRLVDFIGLHKLSYWEEIPVETAAKDIIVDISDMQVLLDLDHLDIPIYMLEIGWPTNGPSEGKADTGLRNQKRYLYEATSLLEQRDIFYNVVEGLDVPSKNQTTEGLVGPHWGILDSNGNTKHTLPFRSLITFVLVYSLSLFASYRYARNIVAISSSSRHIYLSYIFMALYSAAFAWTIAQFFLLYGSGYLIFQISFALILSYAFLEFNIKTLQIIFGKHAIEHLRSLGTHLDNSDKRVSILIAGKDEPAEQMLRTIESCVAQTHANLEVLYLDNNSQDKEQFDALKKLIDTSPQLKHALETGRLQLFFEPHVPHFKAGALNYLLAHISKDSEIIAVLDSDYVVDKDWIETGLAYFASHTGFVQFPQAYSKSLSQDRSLVREAATTEQHVVFDILYPIRSLVCSFVQNGTMVLIRRIFLHEDNDQTKPITGWPTWGICEDAGLGARIDAMGGTAAFVPHIKGTGLAPHTFEALAKQRYRWVFGSMQIIKHALRHPFEFKKRTMLLFAIDWSAWIMHILYPLLLVSSFGFVAFAWMVYLHTQLSWVIYVGFVSIAYSLLLFAVSFFRMYGLSSYTLRRFGKLILMELAMVNSICYAMYSSLFKRKAAFTITREISAGSESRKIILKKAFIKRMLGLSIATLVILIGLIFYSIIFLLLNVSLAVQLVAAVQLTIVLLPQVAFFYLVAIEEAPRS